MKKIFYLASLFMLTFLVSCGSDPEKSHNYLNQGTDYLYTSQFEEAIELYEKAIKADKNNYEAYYYLGCAYINLHQKEDAKCNWLKAIELKPDYADPYFNLGLLYRRDNDYEMACYYFKEAEKYGRPNMQDYTRHCQ